MQLFCLAYFWFFIAQSLDDAIEYIDPSNATAGILIADIILKLLKFSLQSQQSGDMLKA